MASSLSLLKSATQYSADDLWVHDERDFYKAQILVRMFEDPRIEGHLPRPFGVFYEVDRPNIRRGSKLTDRRSGGVKG